MAPIRTTLWRVVLTVLGVAVIVHTADGDLTQNAVSTFNALRRKEPASDMARVEWDAGLAKQAGPNGASCASPPAALGVVTASTISDFVTNFTVQKQHYNHTESRCTTADCSLYLQVVFSDVTKVGCNIAPCGLNGESIIRCFFNKKVDINVAPYTLVDKQYICTACPIQLSGCDNGLCYEPSSATTIKATMSTTVITTATTTAAISKTTEPTTKTTEVTTTIIEPVTTTTQPITTTITTTTTAEPATTTPQYTTTTMEHSTTTKTTTEPSTTTMEPTTAVPTTTTEPTTSTTLSTATTESTTATTISATTTIQPITTSTEPPSTTTEPTITTEPATTITQPTTTTTQPTTSTTQSTTTMTEPTTTTVEPTTTTTGSTTTLKTQPTTTTSDPTTTTTQGTMTTTEPTPTTTQSTTTLPTQSTTTTADVSTVDIWMVPLDNVLNNEEKVTKTLKEKVSTGLNIYCCSNTHACCGLGTSTKVVACPQFPFIGEDGIRFRQGGPTNRTVNSVSMAVYEMYVVTNTNNALCVKVKELIRGARKRRALAENEMIVSHQVLRQSIKDSEVQTKIETVLSSLNIVVTVQEPEVPADITSVAPTAEAEWTMEVWMWAIVSVGALAVLSMFVIIGVLCSLHRKMPDLDDDAESQDAVVHNDSQRRLVNDKRPSHVLSGWGTEEQNAYSQPYTIGRALRYSSKHTSYRGGSIGTGGGMFEQQYNGFPNGMRRDVTHWEQDVRRPIPGPLVPESLYADSAAPYGRNINYEEFNQRGSNNRSTPEYLSRSNR